MSEMSGVDVAFLKACLSQSRNRWALRRLGGKDAVLGYAWEAAHAAYQKGKDPAYLAEAIHKDLIKRTRKEGRLLARHVPIDDPELQAGLLDPGPGPDTDPRVPFTDTKEAARVRDAVSAVARSRKARKVMRLLSAGHSVRKVAEKTGLHVRTVKKYMRAVATRM